MSNVTVMGSHWKGCWQVHTECHPIILALDASSTNVGYCIAQGERYIDSGVYSPKGNSHQRVHQIARWTLEMIDTYDPDYTAIEEPMGHHRNLKTDRLLARTCGNVEGVCTIRGVLTLWIHPKTVKGTGLHKGACRAAANLIRDHTLKDVGPDEADAIGVWQATLGLLKDYHFRNLVLQQQIGEDDESTMRYR